jgi:hypothetical protein
VAVCGYLASESSKLSVHPQQVELESLEECGEGGGVFIGISSTCQGSVCVASVIVKA